MTMTRTAWLKCQSINVGMFSDEFLVVIKTADGEQASFFVPKEFVKTDESLIQVKTTSYDRMPEYLVTIPTSQPEVISIDANDLVDC